MATSGGDVCSKHVLTMSGDDDQLRRLEATIAGVRDDDDDDDDDDVRQLTAV